MPSAEVVAQVLEEISKGSRQLAYFFERASSPSWIAPLAEAGVFAHPYRAEIEEGYVRFPSWPPGRYLARMAGDAPDEVYAVLRDLPETDNERVHEDVVTAALALPIDMSAEIARREAQWVSGRERLHFVEDELTALVVRLAGADRFEVALELARPLLELQPDQAAPTDDFYAPTPHPEPRFSDWQYGRLAPQVLGALFRADRTRGAAFALDLLEESVRLSSRTREDGQRVDHSYIWRSAIEDHEQNTHRGVEDTVLSVVRDQFESEIRQAPEWLSDAVALLEERDIPLLRRLALHIVRLFAPPGSPAIRRYLLDRELLNCVLVWHEYARLLAERFQDLEEPDRAALLALISLGPPQPADVEDADPEDFDRYASIWRLRRLTLIKDHLTGSWSNEYEALTERFGTSDHPEFMSYGRSFVGPTSPMTAEALRELTIDDVVSYLATWTPDQGWAQPSPEGLARALTQVASEDSEVYSAAAMLFMGLDPTYVRGLISGLETALRNKSSIEWPPVVGLSEWVVSQPRQIDGRASEYSDLDPGWVWTRKEIAALFSLGFESQTSEPPVGLAPRIWSVVRELSADPEPTPEYEQQYGGDNMDPTMLSLNTVRGQAMHAVVRFGLWMNRAAEAAGRDTDTAKMCQTLVNETKGVLELHLDPNVDPSLTVRAVYGQWFPWLTVLDRAWAEQIASDVFPAAEGAEAYWHAAWDAYITWTQPYNEMLALLDDHYRLAISRASDDAGQRLGATSSPAERLAEHIVIFYWRGLIDLADETSILHQLFADGPAELRSRAIGFVGQALSNEATADSLPGEVKERLQALWAWRVDQATLAKQARPLLNELNAFGWWASSPAFDDDWVLDQLTTVMSLGGHPEPDFVVLERLVRTALPFPGRTVTLLAEYLKSQKQPWSVLGHRDEIASIVESAILSKDRTALTGTVDLLEWLGAQGFQEFRPTYDRAAAVLAGFT